MVVCKFFQQGNCRYGQGCKFEHIYGAKYSYQANSAAQGGITDEQLINQVQTDIKSALNGDQWLLSVYAPFKEKPSFPGFYDLSPEEARLFIYEAKANNTIDQAVVYFNSLVQDAKSKYEQLLQPTPILVKAFRSLYRGEVIPSPFASTQPAFGGAPNSSSVFRSAVQNSSVFGQCSTNTQSIFGSSAGSNIFASQNTESTAPKSIFAQANQNVFGNSPSQPANPNSIFASASQKFFGSPTNSPFGQTASSTTNALFAQPASSTFPHNAQQSILQYQEMQTQYAFGKSNNVFQTNADVFGQNNAFGTQTSAESFFGKSQTPSNLFGQASSNLATSSNVFGQSKNIFEHAKSDDTSIYSKIEDLTEEDLEAFKSETFALGFVPELPPPQFLCV